MKLQLYVPPPKADEDHTYPSLWRVKVVPEIGMTDDRAIVTHVLALQANDATSLVLNWLREGVDTNAGEDADNYFVTSVELVDYIIVADPRVYSDKDANNVLRARCVQARSRKGA